MAQWKCRSHLTNGTQNTFGGNDRNSVPLDTFHGSEEDMKQETKSNHRKFEGKSIVEDNGDHRRALKHA